MHKYHFTPMQYPPVIPDVKHVAVTNDGDELCAESENFGALVDFVQQEAEAAGCTAAEILNILKEIY